MYAAAAGCMVLAVCLVYCHALSTQGNRIMDENNNTITLKGVNWFGFNNGATMVDGLWAADDGFTYDFATIIYRWQLLGFNAIRLPFSMQDLYTSTTPPYSKLSSACSLPTFTQIAYSVTDPADDVAAGLAFPPPLSWPAHSPNTCNEYLPADTTLARFLWVVQYLAHAGFFIIIDDHNQDPTPADSPTQFISYWVDIVTQISSDPVAAQRLIVDVLNEPDSRGWGWDVMGPLYLQVMDAVYPINNDVLFLVEGCGQLQGALAYNWGDGFVTSAGVSGRSDPNPFFRSLLSKPYLDHVALGPHVYGPSISLAADNFSGPGLWDRLTLSFGSLTTAGYTADGVTRAFPVVIGEVGSNFLDARDRQFLADFAAYLLNAGAAADGAHAPIPHVLWWAWNANSADTGGLVDASWYALDWTKLRYLNSLGVTPWYKDTATALTASEPAPTPTPAPAPGPACQARLALSSTWSTSLGPTASVNFYVKTLGSEVVPAPWAFQLYHPSYTGLSSPWNVQSLTFDSGAATGISSGMGWMALMPGGAEVNMGMHVSSSSSAAFIPSTFAINGVDCAIVTR